jgi:hypothetical protein
MKERPRRQWTVTATSGEALLLAGAAVAAIGVPVAGTFGQQWPIVALTAAAMEFATPPFAGWGQPT